jgi:DNA invertase Pin-like site-specific DNA recombinase
MPRYSSDTQRDASIEDQLRQCREYAARQGWTVVESYSDRAISGTSLIRAGIQDLLADAPAGRFDIVLSEALDRISRDQEDVAAVFKRLRFAGVSIVTLSEGDISELHVGLKGTMNALFLKDLALKTHRGIRGRVEAGKIGGGNAYGYRVVKTLDARGEPVRGEREIIEAEAEVVHASSASMSPARGRRRSPLTSTATAFPARPASAGPTPPSAATAPSAPAFSTANSISASSAGTGSAS